MCQFDAYLIARGIEYKIYAAKCCIIKNTPSIRIDILEKNKTIHVWNVGA